MGLTEGRGPKTVWANPAEIIRSLAPENPVMAFAPSVLRATARRYLDGFPGLVTYAVKAMKPQRLLIVDVAALGLAPGEMRFVDKERIRSMGIASTDRKSVV